MKLALAALLMSTLITPARPAERVTVFVELASAPAVEARSATQARSARDRTAEFAGRVVRSSGGREVTRTSNALPGVVLNIETSRLSALPRMREVRAVHRMVPKTLANASAVRLTKTVDAWRNSGKLGDGIKIGVIDTGIDYNHTDFGGPGTFPTAKVVGGYDFVGDDYTGSIASVPVPDGDPMDCDGHGTHVAGTAAGFGVSADGSTYRGSYTSAGLDLDSMRIGPGTAPHASLYALRVFGCKGGTNLTAKALDWALDPNGDGDFTDHLDVVNLSLGSDFGAPDDPDALFVRQLVKHGVVVVAAAGNGGDFYDVGGSPGNTPEALTVANSRDAFAMRDGVAVAGKPVAGQYGKNFTKPLDLELPVVRLESNVDGCEPITESLTGKFVWLEWDDNDATRACGSGKRADNAWAAGAAGVLLPSTLELFAAGIGGNAHIPEFQFTAPSTTAVRPALDAGTLTVRMTDSLRRAVPTVTPSLTDRIVPSSSRSRAGKPDVAAPGDSIFSAASGTRDHGKSEGGTSMASPHVAGIAALLRQSHPDWTVEEIKAAIMNTAGAAVRSDTGLREAPMRAGAGRVDALSALNTEVLAMAASPSGEVGVSFGTVEAAGPVSLDRTIKLVNKSAKTVRLSGGFTPITTVPGVTFRLTESYLVIPPGKTAETRLRLQIANPAQLRKTADPTVDLAGGRQFLAEASGLAVFTADQGASLRVPVYAAPKPVSALSVADGKVTGRGLDQKDYRARMTVLKLGGTSPRLPDCGGEVQQECAANRTARGADLRYVGATATRDLLAFGVATWDTWADIGSNTSPEIQFSVGGKSFRTKAVKPTNADDEITEDLWLARTTDEEGEVIDEQPLNGRDGAEDTNLFDSDVVVLPVSRSKLPEGPVTYTAGITSRYTTPTDPDDLVDELSAPMTFDYQPLIHELSTVVTPGDTVPDDDLILFHHNASGSRALAR
ncbi:S8 family serine peptidase [Amycolatopsis sp. NPDC059657]|uniref:S8 family peptidase n=1 Tax=Amycolatopsis sp. NPDC059657 TaxID=3346899 RepID=UPI00366F6B44